jgi:DNA-binding transcriptional LysR family regulator
VPVVAAGHPLTRKKRLVAADLSAQPLLMREPGSDTRELIERTLHRQGIRPGSVVEFGNTEAIKQAAIHGGGIAFLPRICMRRAGQRRSRAVTGQAPYDSPPAQCDSPARRSYRADRRGIPGPTANPGQQLDQRLRAPPVPTDTKRRSGRPPCIERCKQDAAL